MDSFQLIFLAAIIIGSAVLGIWRRYSLGRLLRTTDRATINGPSGSAIFSYYTAGHSLVRAAKGKLQGMKYSFYVTLPGIGMVEHSYVVDDAAIYALELPFNTQSHILGLSKDHKLSRVQFEQFLLANGLKKIQLEGDFSDYFDLYAGEGQDFQVRYVLDPAAMSFVVDYCREHFWEINDAELYIVATNNDPKDTNNTNLLQESQMFVEQIKPALLPGQPGAPVVHHEASYGEYDGPQLACPVCGKQMTIEQDAWHVCPDGHGVLINGRDLVKLHEHKLSIQLPAGQAAEHGELTCPNCHNQMVHTNYEGSDLQIDSCEHCPYRWLDAGEVDRILSRQVSDFVKNAL